MLPIRDLNPTRTSSYVTWLIVAGTALIFFVVQGTQERAFEQHLYASASIPCEVTTGDPLTVAEINGAPCEAGGQPAFPEKNVWFSVLASIFFHGGIGHLISNLWVLLIFGNNVEDAFGHMSYLIFYLVAGLVASGAHIFLRPESTIPVVGASGAIAGVMGAYAVLFPGARVTTIVPPFFFWPFVLPAMLFLGIWFVSQFLLAGAESNIAWEAHVAGFGFGLVVALLGRRKLRQHSTATESHYPIGRRYR
ncbi:MAG TPA: rhomboid family intramembrane serine protease [Acidimicrobiia bacterium]